ncbi:MAG: methyltransferase domain-containing protein [Alphaproteobacteria bacterium]|nr:methyltransferase domain-containing protein [Alphaproteobacteria bacterium]
MKNPVTRYFDNWANSYDETMRGMAYVEPQRIAEALRPKLAAGARLLDIGIGTGLTVAPFQGCGIHITGIDASPGMLEICRAKMLADSLICHDAALEPMPLGAQSLDAAICAGTLEYIADPLPFFQDVARVLKPGGLFAFTFEPTQTAPLYRRGFLNGCVKTTQHRITVQRFMPRSLWPRVFRKYLFTPEGITLLIENSGFAIKSRELFDAYQWQGKQPIPHYFFVAERVE